MAPISFTSSKGSNKYRPVWIARLSAVKAAAARGDYLQMLCLGVRASVVAQPYMGRMVRILPSIDNLPENAVIEAPVPEEGEAVVILLFDSLHRYTFVYEALRDIATACAPRLPTCTATNEENIEQRDH